MRIIIDTREQTPFTFPDTITTERGTLQTGDYSLKGLGLTELCAIERKSLPDLVGCCTGSNRARFKRELHRLRGYRCKAVVITADVDDVMNHGYRSRIAPSSVLGSVASWQTRYQVPFVFAGAYGAEYTLAIFRNFIRQLEEVAGAIDLQLK